MTIKLLTAGIAITVLAQANSISAIAGASACITFLGCAPSQTGPFASSVNIAPAGSGSTMHVLSQSGLTATYGGLFGTATANVDTGTWFHDRGSNISASGGAGGTASFDDTEHVAPGLPTGLPIQVLFTAVVAYGYDSHGSFDASNNSNDGPITSAALSASATVNGKRYQLTGGSIGQTALTIVTVSDMFTFLSGSSYDFSESLTMSLGIPAGTLPYPALAGSDSANGFAELLVGNSVHLYFDVLTPGATLVSDSGHDYSSPASTATPEPASSAVTATGLVLLALAGRRLRYKNRNSA